METPRETPLLPIEAQKEKEGEIDFAGIFDERLAAAKVIPETERELTAINYREMGLKYLKTQMPAVIFEWENGQEVEYHVWVLPENDPDKRVYHDKVREVLVAKLGDKRDRLILGPFSGHLLVGRREGDKSDQLFLGVHESFSEVVKSGTQQHDEEFWEKWQKFMKTYQIRSIVGNFTEAISPEKRSALAKRVEILNIDIVGEMMENRELMKKIRESGLNNWGALRFFLEYNAQKEVWKGLDPNAIIEKLAGDRKYSFGKPKKKEEK